VTSKQIVRTEMADQTSLLAHWKKTNKFSDSNLNSNSSREVSGTQKTVEKSAIK
jgi:hypothetical protein